MAKRIGIIGGGNMGEAIARGCIAAGVFKPDDLVIAEVDQARRNRLADLRCDLTDNPLDAAHGDIIILAVKPQVFPAVAKTIAPLESEKLVISIMAGLSSASIRNALGESVRVIRTMPNTPCQIGVGMTAIARGEGALDDDVQFALRIFNSLGKTVIVDESLMYAVTAVSGSGPAYVFLLAEAMEHAATSMGFDSETARLLVEQTVMGAGRLLSESPASAADLRKAVTSPGGTTAAALDVFTHRRFDEIVIEALTAARDRGKQLDRT